MRSTLIPPLRLVFFMWLFYFVEQTTGYDLAILGIYPRSLEGLLGIVFAPLLHGSISHISSNTIPILILGGTLYFFYPKQASRVFLQCYFFTNFFVWLFARPFYHIGASGFVYGLACFLIGTGFFQRDFKSIIIALIVILTYGSLIYGLFSVDQNVSWESHLMGAIVGIGSAFGIKRAQSDR